MKLNEKIIIFDTRNIFFKFVKNNIHIYIFLCGIKQSSDKNRAFFKQFELHDQKIRLRLVSIIYTQRVLGIYDEKVNVEILNSSESENI